MLHCRVETRPSDAHVVMSCRNTMTVPALTKTLWLVLVGPALGILWQVLVARRRLARAKGSAQRRELRQGGWAGVFGIFAAAVAVLAHAVVLARMPAGGRALYEHLARGAQVAGLEAPLDLWMDPQAAAACGPACAVACAAAVLLATGPTFERTWTRWVWLQLALGGALLAFLGDSLFTVAAGWALAGGAGAWLAGWGDARRGIAAASWGVSAVAALLLGSSLLFWGFGGTWDDEGYAPESESLVAVRAEGRAGGTLSMTAPAGARVAIDGAKTPSLRVPFVRAPLAAGSHSIRIEGVGASETYFTAADRDDVVLVALGPTLSIHAMRDALSVRDARGEPELRREIEGRVAPGGVSLVAAVLLLWLLATGALSVMHVPLASPRPLAALAGGATSSMLGPYLLVRVHFLFPSAQHTGVVVACAGAAIVLGSTWRALAYDGLQRWLVFTMGAAPGLVCVVLGLGGEGRALLAIGVVGVGVAALHLAAARRLFPRVEESADAVEETLLVRVPARLGALLTSMERWVVGSVADAAGGAARVAAWMVAAADEHLVASPADRVADGVVLVSGSARALVGGSLGLVVWSLVGLAGAAALLHALWPGG
jgi:hypothetical protein